MGKAPPNIGLQRTSRRWRAAAEAGAFGARIALAASLLIMGACSSTTATPEAKNRAERIRAAEDFLEVAAISVSVSTADRSGGIALCPTSTQTRELRTILLRLCEEARKQALVPLPLGVQAGGPAWISQDYVVGLRAGGRMEALVLNLSVPGGPGDGQYMEYVTKEGSIADIGIGDAWRELAKVIYSMGKC